jgi:hypothetical protein
VKDPAEPRDSVSSEHENGHASCDKAIARFARFRQSTSKGQFTIEKNHQCVIQNTKAPSAQTGACHLSEF